MARPAQAGRKTAGSVVAGIGVYLPPRSAQGAAYVSGLDCTGVSDRVKAEKGISTPSLAAAAARAALKAAGGKPDEVELVIVGTTSPDVLWPTTACLVQNELGLGMVTSFDLYAAEAGVLTALDVANRYMATGARGALVIGAESDNQLVDLPALPRAGRGRAAAAVLLRPAGGDEAGILSTVVGGAASEDGTGASHDEALVRGLCRAIDQCLGKAGISLAAIDLVIGEQTAPEVMRAWRIAQAFPEEKLVLDAKRYSGAVAAAPFVVLHDLVAEGRLRSGMTALLVSCGSGPAWAVVCLRWGSGRAGKW
jgi:3-oxoacyl-[acyl-carrier-protein] synthase-3